MSKYLQRIDLELDRLLSEGKEEKPKIKKPSCFLSKAQIDEHYDEHYLKYLVNLREAQKDLKRANDPSQFRLAASEVTLNFNAIKLHESYFGSLGSTKMNADFESLLKKNFGSKDNFMKQLKFACLAARDGWALLGVNCVDKTLHVNFVDSHDVHTPLYCPILALDIWEHAFYIDYKADKEKYVNDLLEDINWESIAECWDSLT